MCHKAKSKTMSEKCFDHVELCQHMLQRRQTEADIYEGLLFFCAEKDAIFKFQFCSFVESSDSQSIRRQSLTDVEYRP